jgi:hypothetical protein
VSDTLTASGFILEAKINEKRHEKHFYLEKYDFFFKPPLLINPEQKIQG